MPENKPFGDYDAAYARLMDPEAQDAESLRYNAQDKPPTAPGAILSVRLSYYERLPDDELQLFFPEGAKVREAMLVAAILNAVDHQKLPCLYAIKAIDAILPRDSRSLDWLADWRGVVFDVEGTER